MPRTNISIIVFVFLLLNMAGSPLLAQDVNNSKIEVAQTQGYGDMDLPESDIPASSPYNTGMEGQKYIEKQASEEARPYIKEITGLTDPQETITTKEENTPRVTQSIDRKAEIDANLNKLVEQWKVEKNLKAAHEYLVSKQPELKDAPDLDSEPHRFDGAHLYKKLIRLLLVIVISIGIIELLQACYPSLFALHRLRMKNNSGTNQVFLGKLSEISGVKRLLIALSILYLLIIVCDLVVNGLFSFKSAEDLVYASMPVWLNWFAYWIFLGFRCKERSLKVQILSIIFLFLLLFDILNQGYGAVLILVSFPIWLMWLSYWVYVGFKK